MSTVTLSVPIFGADPEVFFTRDGKVVSSDVVISLGGIETGCGKLVRDGVQAEIQAATNMCRETFCARLATSLYYLHDYAKAAQCAVNYDSVVTIPEDVFQTFPEDARRLGCAPSANIHDPSRGIAVDGSTYRVRSAGGHIHLGGLALSGEHYVPLLDALVGNTFVLLDRHPRMAERREVYGRAGEFRLPKSHDPNTHRLEYRTLSNFWLQSPVFTGLALGLARQAVSYVDSGVGDEILSRVTIWDAVEAINANDPVRALGFFMQLKEVLKGYEWSNAPRSAGIGIRMSLVDECVPFTPARMEEFALLMQEYDPAVMSVMQHVFGRDMRRYTSWTYRQYWEKFIDEKIVNRAMARSMSQQKGAIAA